MLNLIYEISNKYRDKSIYIWDVCRNSTALFTKLAFGSKMISGFVTDKDKFIGNKFLNLPVIGIEDYPDDGAVLVLADYSDACKNKVYEKVRQLIPNAEIVWYKELYDISECLLQEKVLIYGTGEAAEEILDVCRENNISIEGFINSKAEENQTFKGYKLYSNKDLWKFKEFPIIVAALIIESQEEIVNDLFVNNCERIYVDHVIDLQSCIAETMFIWINKAIYNEKKIYIYSAYNEYLKTTLKAFEKYGILVNGIVYEKSDEENLIEDVYSLSYMDLSDIFVYINERIPTKVQKVAQLLRDLGMEYEDFAGAYQSRGNYTEYKTCLDMLVGNVAIGNTERRGMYIYGKDKVDDLKILVLGGSTSTEKAYLPESWVQKMYNMYLRNRSVTIYNGANVSFDVMQELMVLLRDGGVIKPNIVISLSGANNLYHKSEWIFFHGYHHGYFQDLSYLDIANDFNAFLMANHFATVTPQFQYNSGLKSDEEPFEFWKRNEKIIYEVAKIIGAKPYIFLQPMNLDEANMDLHEYSLHIMEKYREGAKKLLSESTNDDFYINALNILSGKDRMYIDAFHYTDEANEIIAAYVYEKIKDTIGEC